MKLSSIVQSGVVLVLAGITVGLCIAFPNAANRPESGLIMWLPSAISGHYGREVEPSDQEKYWLPDDTTQLKMQYLPYGADQTDMAYQIMNATLILAGSDKRSLHRPEVCMVGQGWTIEKSEVVPIKTSSGILEVKDLWLKRPIETLNGNEAWLEAHYVYWWVGKNGSTAHTFERALISAANNIFRNQNDRWGYPSVMVTLDPRLGEKAREEARRRVFTFIAENAPKFQKSLGAVDRSDAKPIKDLGN